MRQRISEGKRCICSYAPVAYVDRSISSFHVLPDDIGDMMSKRDFESPKAVHAVSPGSMPEPFFQGNYIQDGHRHWKLPVEFRPVGQQPPDPEKFVEKLIEMHKKSPPPNGELRFPRHDASRRSRTHDKPVGQVVAHCIPTTSRSHGGSGQGGQRELARVENFLRHHPEISPAASPGATSIQW